MKYLDLTGLQLFWTKIKNYVRDTDKVAAGNGIGVGTSDGTTGKQTAYVVIDSTNANGLSVGANGVALAVATDSAAGAMSAADHTKLTNAYTKLEGIEAGAQVNVIETVKVNGSALTVDGNKAVDVTVSIDNCSDTTIASLADNQVLQYDATSGKWKNETLPAAVEYSLTAKAEPDTAYAMQYEWKVDNVLTTTINIPKDQFLKEAKFYEDAAAATADGKSVPSGQQFPAIYFAWELTGGVTSPTWIAVDTLVDTYTAGPGLGKDGNEFYAKVTEANGLSIDDNTGYIGLATVVASTSGTGGSNGAMTAAQAEKLAGITDGATKTEASTTNGNIKINGSEVTVYTHEAHTAYNAAVYKFATNAQGHVTDAVAATAQDITYSGNTTIYDKIGEMDAATANYLVASNVDTTAYNGVSLWKNGNDFGVTVTPGAVEENNGSVVTGGVTYTAIEAAKTALLGDATANGDTLGKLEDRIEAAETAHTGGAAYSGSYYVIKATNSTGHVTDAELATAITETEINNLS